MPHRFINDRKTNATILIVDDDIDLLDVMHEEISLHFTEVLVAKSAKMALEFLETHPVNCVLTDYRMPGMSGLELIEILQRDYPKIPVLLVTGNGQNPEVLAGVANGCFDFVEKPFQFSVLINRIQNSLLLPLLEDLINSVFASEFPAKTMHDFVHLSSKNKFDIIQGLHGLISTRLLSKDLSRKIS